jgi:hypothetical protein
MTGKIKQAEIFQPPFISVKAKIVMPGTTNSRPNIKYQDDYVVAPSAKKIATYIKNQLFGSELFTQTEGMEINWLMPTLSEALEKAIYQTESFIYLHKYNDKVYLECLYKNDIHDIVQVFDQFKEGTIVQEYELDKDIFELHRHITITGDGTSTVEYKAYIIESDKPREITIDKFNSLFGTEYEKIENKPYEVVVNIDTGQDFFKDSKKLLTEEMLVINTIAEEVEKTKTRIATSQHYMTGDIATNWQPKGSTYDIQTINVGTLQDYFVLMPGDKDHQIFQFLQGDVRTQQYEETFRFYDYQIIQMAGLSPATFGYEKDRYMNVLNVDLSANNSEMTIEAIKRQLEPQINRLIENIIRLQVSQNITTNVIPSDIQWEYGANERIDDMKKVEIISEIQKAMNIPYEIRAEILQPIISKLAKKEITAEDISKAWNDEENKMNIEFGEL